MQLFIVPLIKTKSGDLKNNYRAITLLTCLSKIFEQVVKDSLITYSDIDKFQFCSKVGHSTIQITVVH